MDFENELCASGRGYNIDVGFFANANAVARAVDSSALEVGVERQIVETTVGKAVPIILSRDGLSTKVIDMISGDKETHIWHSSFARLDSLSQESKYTYEHHFHLVDQTVERLGA